jgi:CRISPR-associated protein Cas2
MADYIIAYDITSPRRLARIYRYMQKTGVHIEYSVFYVTCDNRRILAILDELAALIDPRHDDLRCYPLPARGVKLSLGKAILPAGIIYTGLPPAWHGRENTCSTNQDKL